MLDVVLCLAPVLVITVLLFRKTAADIAGWCGFAVALLIAWLYFGTSLEVLLRASLSGALASFPIALCIAASIFQILVMSETGALARIVAFLKCLTPGTRIQSGGSAAVAAPSTPGAGSETRPEPAAPAALLSGAGKTALPLEERVVQLLLLNFALGTMLTALGAVTISIFPPIMLALGYSVFAAIVMPCIGYVAFCSYALLSVPAMILGNLAGISMHETAVVLARFMPVTSLSVALVMLWLAGGRKMLAKGLLPAVLAGLSAGYVCILVAEHNLLPLTGIVAGLTGAAVLLLYERLRGCSLFDKALMNDKDLAVAAKLSFGSAISPWILLVLVSLLVNWPTLPFFNYLFGQWAMPVEIFPGRPEKVRLFWQAYFWILVTTVISVPFMKARFSVLKTAGQRWFKIGLRPLSAAMVYFALAYVMNLSGYDATNFKLQYPENNMIHILAKVSAATFERYYAVAAPYLGLLAGFISGSQSSAVAMLTTLHVSTSDSLGLNATIVAAAGAIGGGLASMLSPTKLLSAAATIGKAGEEGAVLRACVLPSLLLVAVVACMALLWS